MSGVLVDTSVWVSHFRERNQGLIDLLDCDDVLIHPMILAEIGCGTPPARNSTLSDLASLQQAQQPSLYEVMDFIERESLFGQGCRIVDMILLASTLITPGSELWTLDKRLSSIAKSYGVMYRPRLH
jgi:predicted nucleic acid-binding protein